MKEVMKMIQDKLNTIAKDGNKNCKFVLDKDFEKAMEDWLLTKVNNTMVHIGTTKGAQWFDKDGNPVPEGTKNASVNVTQKFISFDQFLNP